MTNGTATPDLATILLRGVMCRCPRCGQAPLFKGLMQFRPQCTACGLDYASADAGDGPAVFAIFIVGGIVTPLALALEMRLSPPWWVHIAIWPAVIILASLVLLPVLKGILYCLQWSHKALEARASEFAPSEAPAPAREAGEAASAPQEGNPTS